MNPAEALTLAAITYRGCEYNLSNPSSRKIVYDEIIKCLKTFSAVKDKWELVWGPAGYCPGAIGLDDSAMFAVRNTREPETLAIVIRGTNFFSLRDWETNFLVDPKPWPYGTPGNDVKVSHSTLLGLNILQALRSPLAPIEATTADQVEATADAAKAVAAKAEAAAGYAFLTKMLGGVAPEGTPSFDIEQIFDRIKEKVGVVEVRHLFGMDDDTALLSDVSAAQRQSGSTKTLLEFLEKFVNAAHGPVDISVIGHSKGGALAPALALWLADTQGAGVPETDQWDPNKRAELQSLTFAAPTPGNKSFANHFKDKVQTAYRLDNPYDLVTHAWDPIEIRQIPKLYGHQLAILGGPAEVLAELAGHFGYQHEVDAKPWSLPLEERPLPAQIAFNHLDAYLTELGIPDPGLRFLEVFKPIR